jgi:hypothetical protein
MWALVPLRNDIAEVLKVTDSDGSQKSILDVGMSRLLLQTLLKLMGINFKVVAQANGTFLALTGIGI